MTAWILLNREKSKPGSSTFDCAKFILFRKGFLKTAEDSFPSPVSLKSLTAMLKVDILKMLLATLLRLYSL